MSYGLLGNLAGVPPGLLDMPGWSPQGAAAPPSWSLAAQQPAQAPMPQQPAPQAAAPQGGFSGFMAKNSDFLTALGASLLSTPTLREGLAGAGRMAPQAMASDKRRGAVTDWIKAGSPRDVQHPASVGLFENAPEIAAKYIGERFGAPQTTDDIREFEYAKSQGFTGSFADWQKTARASGASGFGNTPIYLTKDGKLGLGRFNDAGGLSVMDTQGYDIADPLHFVDRGPDVLPVGSRTGLPRPSAPDGGVIAKDPRAEAREKEVGKGEGEALNDLPRALNAGQLMIDTIDKALLDPEAVSRVTGPIQSRLMNVTATAHRGQSYIDQIQGGTFLQAYSVLKGGGQITEIEGEKAEKALNRLRSTGMDDADYVVALNEFRTEVKKLMNIARERAGKQPEAGDGWTDVGGGVKIRAVPQQ